MGILSALRKRREALNREASLKNKHLAQMEYSRVANSIDEIFHDVLVETTEKPKGRQPLHNLFDTMVAESKAWEHMINVCDASLSEPSDNAFREVEVAHKKALDAHSRMQAQGRISARIITYDETHDGA